MRITSHIKFFVLGESEDNNYPSLTLMEVASEDIWSEIRVESDKGLFHFEFNQIVFPILENVDTKLHVYSIQDILNQAQAEYIKVINDEPDADPNFTLYEHERKINMFVLNSVPSLRDRLDSFASTVANNFMASINTATQKQLN